MLELQLELGSWCGQQRDGAKMIQMKKIEQLVTMLPLVLSDDEHGDCSLQEMETHLEWPLFFLQCGQGNPAKYSYRF